MTQTVPNTFVIHRWHKHEANMRVQVFVISKASLLGFQLTSLSQTQIFTHQHLSIKCLKPVMWQNPHIQPVILCLFKNTLTNHDSLLELESEKDDPNAEAQGVQNGQHC
ncbi:hypothetical protein GOODEAATRI_000133 [Goodea atripinnis]|uniref:Uncharacterized protein n=1 Tax=Goodea atripinnis TaxID=208336 RepID=A0ABV0N9U9_9TELE